VISQPVAPTVAEGIGRASSVRVNLRGWVETALQRLQSSDVAMTVHAASSGGGGRITSVAALIGICISGVGAGTYCVATALLPDPKPRMRAEATPQKKTSDRGKRSKAVAPRTREPVVARARIQARDEAKAAATAVSKTRQTRTARSRSSTPDEFSFESGGAAGSRKADARSRPSSATDSSATSSAGPGASAGPVNGAFETGPPSATTPARSGEFESGGEFSP